MIRLFHVKHNAVPVADSTLRARIEPLVDLVERWNDTVRLVSRKDIPELWRRHVEDSLQLLPFVPPKAKRAIDLGSGAGFPGLILSVATGLHVDLVEADQRKAAFLREAVHRLRANATVQAERIEVVTLAPAELVTARALAALPQLCGYAAPLLAAGGLCLFMKGAGVEAEIEAAKADWHMMLQSIPSRTDPSGRLLAITGLRSKKERGA
jgi:16S rRNA (guanine527-N7)-methyltransferase